MYVNLPNATPSRAIIRTFDRGDYDGYSAAKLAQIRDEIGGNIEGDIPGITLGKNEQMRFIFQDDYKENVLPDKPPKIVIKEYLNVSVLPKDDRVYEYEARLDEDNKGEIREVRDTLTKDSNGYFYVFDNALVNGSSFEGTAFGDMGVCLIELYYTIEGHEYVSTTALYL